MDLRKVLVLAIIMFTGSAVAEDPWKDQAPAEYIVKKGDTLWGISARFLENPWLWPEIWHVNSQIKNPHMIYPNDRLQVVSVNGKKMLTLVRGNGSPGHHTVGDVDSDDVGSGNVLQNSQSKVLTDGTIKLSPKTRVSKLDTVIPAIPLEAVQSFLTGNRVIDKGDFLKAPRVVAGGESHILMGVGDKFYAKGAFEDHRAYGVFREAKPFVDPVTEEVLGYQAIELGLAKMLDIEGTIATLRLLSSNRAVRIDDHLLPTLERKLDSVFFPKSPSVKVDAKIIHVFGGVKNVSQYDVVVLNKGDRDQLEIGDVLAVYRVGERVVDSESSKLLILPSERAGLLIVFRIFDKVSYGLVLKANRVLKVLDEVKNP